MKLKTLLLGSAAALIAVSGARAADAVVAEPEPMEYVKVCDMYGAGFFYIPGTETCLAMSGYVRVDYTYLSNDDQLNNDDSRWDYRVRINFDARNETDHGTLRSQIRLQSDGNGGRNTLDVIEDNGTQNNDGWVGMSDGFVGVDRALISLAGFRLGYSDSYTTTLHGYGLPVEKYDGYYAYDQAIFFDYTYAANGFTATVGVQDSTARTGTNGHQLTHGQGTPGQDDGKLDIDIYVGGSYSGSWGNVAASYIHEGAPDEGAWKVSATVNAIENLTLRGFYVAEDGNGVTAQVSGAGEWAWGAGAAYQVTDTFNVRAGYTDRDCAAGVANCEQSYWVVGAKWDPVPGLSIRPEAQFHENDDQQYSVRVYRTW